MKIAWKFAPSLLVLVAVAGVAQDAPPPATAPAGPIEVDVVGGVNAPMTVAVPVMPTPAATPTDAGDTAALGRQVSGVIAADLRSTGAFTPIGPNGIGTYPASEAGTPAFPTWRSTGAASLVSGYVEAAGPGRVTVACYLHDVAAGRELAHQGFSVAAGDWRQAAHKCADLVYSRLSGQKPFLDTRIVYVAETGPKNARIKRIALMDSDGSNHRYLTQGRTTVIDPRFSPRGNQLVYTTYIGRRPRVILLDIASGQERLLIPGNVITFAPRFSPDGRDVAFTMADGGNSDIYTVSAGGGSPRRLTSTPGADTAPDYSPDGRRIVFESDRSGSQQLYVMNADGSNQHRISFGGQGRYASPVWSPRGDLIAYTRISGNFRIAVMNANGGGEKVLTDSWQDESPSWAPNGQFVMFNRTAQGSGDSRLYAVSIDGGAPRLMPTPVGGSDPSWSPLN